MVQFIKYIGAYLMWIADLGLTFWLIFISRTVFLSIFALSYKGGPSFYAQQVYSQRVDFADKLFSIMLGLGWLAFMIAVEAYFRAGAAGDDLFVRFTRVTGPVVLGIFVVDLILFWLQGVGGGDWLRWLILAAELGIGITLLKLARPQSKPNPI
jgi:hypothetical protein